jgi:hypothetical protein
MGVDAAGFPEAEWQYTFQGIDHVAAAGVGEDLIGLAMAQRIEHRHRPQTDLQRPDRRGRMDGSSEL